MRILLIQYLDYENIDLAALEIEKCEEKYILRGEIGDIL
jgi:hypothetical protein